MVLFDFSLKYLLFIHRTGNAEEKELPQPNQNRIVFFNWVYGDKERKLNYSGVWVSIGRTVKDFNVTSSLSIWSGTKQSSQRTTWLW
jgi:hypothetical protein